MAAEFTRTLFEWAAATSPWEVLAVALAIAYLLLAIRENPWCWPAAILSSLIYIALMYGASLYMESALQVFYVAVAVYGWWAWRPMGEGATADGPGARPALVVRTWSRRRHAAVLAAIVGSSAASGALLAAYTGAALPYLDSFTTWGAIVATWMVARKLLENWLYWFVIDSVSLGLYLNRGLYLTAGLFLLYLVLIVVGFRAWQRSWRRTGQAGSVALTPSAAGPA